MKIGDKVRVKSLEEVLKIEGFEDYRDVGGPGIAYLMLDFFGKEGLITACHEDGDCRVWFDEHVWFFTNSFMFKKEWLEEISTTRVEEIKNPTYDDLKPLFSDSEPKDDEYDTVERPEHYNVFEREVIYVIKDLLDNNDNYSGFESYCIGNSLKYIFRAGLKGDFYEDLEKARYYINKILEGRGNQ